MPGDLNGDLVTNVMDLSVLADAVRVGNQQSRLDVDSSGTVDAADVQAFLVDTLMSIPGDANLDGYVDGSDFNRWNDHKFQSCNLTLTEGDFNFDGLVDGSDFNIWSANRFTAVAAAEVGAARAPQAAAALAMADNDGNVDVRGIDADGVEPMSRGINPRRQRTQMERRQIGRQTDESVADELFRDLRDWL
jgi:hypothetical protein